MAKYMTRQRKLLLEYFSRHVDETLSAGQIVSDLAGEDISVSAIYRNLADLEQEGRLTRSARTGSSELTYRFTDEETCRGHLHLTCKRCGRTYHMEHEDADRLIANVARNEGFAIDSDETVLYGVCRRCQN